MIKTAEAVSLGHPDKTADYISSYILDRLIEQDRNVHYGVEVMLKDNTVVLGGEVSGKVDLHRIDDYVRQALREIGYDEKYAALWQDNTININKIKVINLLNYQSREIAQGVEQNGWGDQGVFVGYACQGPDLINAELYWARKLNRALYDKARCSDNLGLDIKTQVTMSGEDFLTVVAAIPMLKAENLEAFITEVLPQKPQEIIINGTGKYTCHSSIADCGVSGRKLACDFYSTACPLGGGSPWTKDATKADLTLNMYARQLAVENLHDNDEVWVYLSSCIGKAECVSNVLCWRKGEKYGQQSLTTPANPQEIIENLGLNKPIYANLCRNGLFSHLPKI